MRGIAAKSGLERRIIGRQFQGLSDESSRAILVSFARMPRRSLHASEIHFVWPAARGFIRQALGRFFVSVEELIEGPLQLGGQILCGGASEVLKLGVEAGAELRGDGGEFL
jgi:hypothetical protein